jgi:hypothetical protein
VTHQRFSVSQTAYIANLSKEERREGAFAVHFASSPNSMIAPVLIVTSYLSDPKGVAEQVAAILEKHWEDS